VAASSLIGGLLLILLVVAAVTIFLAFRHRLAFRIAMRNVRRGRARTALLVAGLLVGTVIISGSLVVGDTVQQLTYHYTYLGAGYVNEAITGTAPTGGITYYPYSVYTQTVQQTAGNDQIAGIAPEIVAGASIYDRTTGIPDTALNLIGVNGNQSQALGPFVADNGTTLEGPSPGTVLIDDQLAGALNAKAGDSVVVFGATSLPLTIEAVVQDNVRGAYITGGLSPGNIFVTLPTAQEIENVSGQINYIAVTNTGTQAEGAASSSAVAAYLNTTLASVLSEHSLTVSTPLANALAIASTSGTDILTIFLALGLFSILAGAMLIIGIFVMLAEERKGEMGMLRAIGMRRRELVYTYYFEGVAYSAGAALAGTFAGVGVGYLLVYLAGIILSAEGIPQAALLQSFSVTTESLIISYVVGFLLTLVTVVAASVRASRLNIVRAIRDVPEPRPHVRTYTFLAYLGGILIVGGLAGYFATYQGTGNISYPIISGGLVIFGAGLVAARFLKNRWVFTLTGAALVIWSGIEPLHSYLFGSAHSSSIFNLFVEGILLVGGMLMVVLFNADLLARGIVRLGGRRIQSSPVARIGTEYPARQPNRTAVSLTIFALVVFTMVATASAGATLQGSLDSTLVTESGGYTFYGYSNTPIPSMWSDISSNTTLAPLFVNAVPLILGQANVYVPGYSGNPYADNLISPPTNASGPANFYETNRFTFQATLHGMSANATFHELATNSSVALVDQSYAYVANSFSTSAAAHPKLYVGTVIQVSTLDGARPISLTVIGILAEALVTGVWLNPVAADALGYSSQNGYLLTSAPGVSSTYASQEAKKAFFPEGLVLFDIRDLVATSISTTLGFIGLLEILVGLGLGVGIVAMGIFALRAVAERRREIGMLRATGFTQQMVLKSFVLEYSFVTLLGIAIGVGLGLLVIFNITLTPEALTAGVQNFTVPWLTIVEIVLIAYALVLVAIAAPSLRAARMPPAEAVRTTE